MECQICNEKLFTPNKVDFSTLCGHVYHEVCIRNWMKTSEHPLCPLCNEPISNAKIHPVYLDIGENAALEMLTVQVSSLSDMMKSRDKKTEDAMKQMQESLEKMSITMRTFETNNEKLKTENEDLKSNSIGQKGLAIQLDPKAASNANYKEVLKSKDATIAALMKENQEMRTQRTENTREMNAIREQVNQLKNAAKGEKRRLGEADEPRQQNLTLKFDNVNDKLIIE